MEQRRGPDSGRACPGPLHFSYNRGVAVAAADLAELGTAPAIAFAGIDLDRRDLLVTDALEAMAATRAGVIEWVKF